MPPKLRDAPLPKAQRVAASPMNRHISATLVRQITDMKGDPSAFVPPAVATRLAARGARIGG